MVDHNHEDAGLVGHIGTLLCVQCEHDLLGRLIDIIRTYRLAAEARGRLEGAKAMQEACEQRLRIESDGRSEQAKAAREAKSKFQARDYESMAIALGQGRSSISFINPETIAKGR